MTTTRVEPECYIPPRPAHPGRPGLRARAGPGAVLRPDGRPSCRSASGRDGEPIYVNLEFLDGTRGAHVSISGISGVATKTSFALFLLHALFTSGVLGTRQLNAKALIFSVKGEDLLFLDQPNVRLDDDLRADYAALGLPATPFGSVGFFAPPVPDDQTGRPNVTGRTVGVSAFWWTLAEFCRDELLPYVFADVEDERNQYTMVVHQVATRLARDARPAGRRRRGRRSTATIVRTWPELVDLIADKVSDDATRADWAGPVTGIGTVNAFIRRLRSSVRAAQSPILRGDLHRDLGAGTIDTANQQVTVIDLQHPAASGPSASWSASPLAAETARKEKAGPGGLLFTMIDELNKYAPREGNSPDQGPAARHRRTRPLARHHPDRRAADRQRGRAPDRVELRRSRSSAGSTRPRPAGPSTASCRPRSGSARPWPSPARCSSPSPRSRCRWPSSSPSRPGRPGSASARRPATTPAPARRRAPCSTGCPPADLDDDDGIDPPPPF